MLVWLPEDGGRLSETGARGYCINVYVLYMHAVGFMVAITKKRLNSCGDTQKS